MRVYKSNDTRVLYRYKDKENRENGISDKQKSETRYHVLIFLLVRSTLTRPRTTNYPF